MKKHRVLILVACLFIVSISCHREEITPTSESEEQTTTSGVYGTVTMRVGNWMPMVGGYDPSAQEYPIACEVAIFDSINTRDLPVYPFPDRIAISDINIHEIARTSTIGVGHYQITVPPGKYSVAIVDGDTIIMSSLNLSNGAGWMEPVEVVEGNLVKHNVLLDYAAY